MAEPPNGAEPAENEPALSVILVIGGQRRRAASALRSVLDQSAIDRIEILLFDLGPHNCTPLEGSDHRHVRTMRSGPEDLLGDARVRGVRAAKAPVVCFLEEHCMMQPGWAETILAAHHEPWAAVGSDFINANPDAGRSNQAFRMNYGVYVRPPAPRGPVPAISGQNSTFKREVLLRYEPQLGLMLCADLVLQWKMQKDGYQMFYEPGVKLAHRNENTTRSLGTGAFYWNWCFSHVRSEVFEWGFLHRVGWLAVCPLMPWVRLFRIGVRVIKARQVPLLQFLRDIPFILIIGHFSAVGQVVGLFNRVDRAVRGFSQFEMNEPRLSQTEYAE